MRRMGGIITGIGIVANFVGVILKHSNVSATSIKINPYMNMNNNACTTFSP